MKKIVLINQSKYTDKRKVKEDYGDPKSNRAIAMRRIAELRKLEIKMKNKKRVYKKDGMVITVYGEGIPLSIMDAPKEFDRIRASLNPLYIVKQNKDGNV